MDRFVHKLLALLFTPLIVLHGCASMAEAKDGHGINRTFVYERYDRPDKKTWNRASGELRYDYAASGQRRVYVSRGRKPR